MAYDTQDPTLPAQQLRKPQSVGIGERLVTGVVEAAKSGAGTAVLSAVGGAILGGVAGAVAKDALTPDAINNAVEAGKMTQETANLLSTTTTTQMAAQSALGGAMLGATAGAVGGGLYGGVKGLGWAEKIKQEREVAAIVKAATQGPTPG